MTKHSNRKSATRVLAAATGQKYTEANRQRGAGVSPETVVLRFEASDNDSGDIFLFELAERGILGMGKYRANRWYVRGDQIEVPLARAGEVIGLPDQLGVDVNVTLEVEDFEDGRGNLWEAPDILGTIRVRDLDGDTVAVYNPADPEYPQMLGNFVMRSPSAPAPADLWFVEANSGERLSGLLPESEARATANELSKTLGLVRVVPGAHVTLRFSAGDGHGGAWFLSALEKRGLVEARPYRDAMGGEFSVPADQVAEVMALPDELGADVEVTQVTRAPATGSTGLRSPEGNGHDEPAPAETSPDKLGAKQVFDAGHVFDATNTHTIWKLAQWRSWRCDRCGLAQDHDEPLHASIPDCLCLPGGGATSHLVCATCLAERRAGGPRVPAQIESDDHAALQSFDATIYLAEAGEGAIEELAGCGWAGDYAADAVAWHLRDRVPEVGIVLSYCEERGHGFEVRLDATAARAWLRAHRPDLAARLDKPSDSLKMFFEVEQRNIEQMRRDGMEAPDATVGSALDSADQAPDDIMAEWARIPVGEVPALRDELAGLAARTGLDRLLDELC
jgi:hypothetical protein